MADVIYSSGISFDFVNFVLTAKPGYLIDSDALSLTVTDPVEGFDQTALIILHGEDFAIRNGKVVDGVVESLDFDVFTGESAMPLETSLSIDGLSLDARTLLDVLKIQDPNLRLAVALDMVFGGDDVITAGKNNDFIYAMGGSDLVSAGKGNDAILVGSGSDTIDGEGEASRWFGTIEKTLGGPEISLGDIVYYVAGESLNVDLESGAAKKASGVDTLIDIQGVVGGVGDDTIRGDDGANVLSGGVAGEDVLRGRGGADYFLFDAGNRDGVTILDFDRRDELLVFDRAAFDIDPAFKLVIGADPSVVSKKSTFLFDLDTRALSFDADGQGDAEAAFIATLKGVKAIALDDFLLI